MSESPVFLMTGPPAARKTTVSRVLMQRFPRGVCLPVDDIREWVVSGLSGAIDWNEDTTLQYRIAEDAAASAAAMYSQAGFAGCPSTTARCRTDWRSGFADVEYVRSERGSWCHSSTSSLKILGPLPAGKTGRWDARSWAMARLLLRA